MRICRLTLALLLAASLAILPLSSAVAMAHAANADVTMSASGDDCPCCKSTHPAMCPLECCQLQALSVEGWDMAEPDARGFVEGGAQAIAPLLLRPDPPPPRV